MKKSIVLLALGIFLLSGQAFATGVTPARAQTVALSYFKFTAPPAAATNPGLAMSLVYTQTETDGTNDFYVFNAAPVKGFVIVSGDDNAIPVIAYSSESNFIVGDMSKIGLSDWMKSSAVKIHYVVTNHIQADANITTLWSSYAQGINPQSTRSGSIGPLCTTTWNQQPYYNSLCPPAALPSTSASKSVTGCVATAMAQIMKYWNYPAQGTGGILSYNDATSAGYSVTYGALSANVDRRLYWSAMPNTVSTDASPVDSLMYELGVAVHMDYDSTGSGAFVLTSEAGGGPCSQTVYADNFFYNPNTLQGVQYSSYTVSAWIALLENEINAGRVVQYEGDDPTEGGHTWVMDGYQANAGGDLLHMNWGWGGAYNGFYAVTNLATPGFNPSQNDAALIGIEPLLPFSITLTPSNPAICPTGNTTLTATGPASAIYTWTPATGLSCTSCQSPTAAPSATTLYTVTVDSAGVTGSMSVAVSVTPPVSAEFTFTAAASCNLPENIAFINSSANATSYYWDFGDGSTGTAASPIHPYNTDGNYTVKLISSNACGADSVIKSQAVQISGGAPIAPNADICSGQAVTLTATGANLTWYSDAAGQNPMQNGNTYQTPSLTSTITYYVGSSTSPSPVSVGPVSDAIGATGEYSNATFRGMTFDNTVAQTLNSVLVYATGAGGRTFAIEDSLGNVLDSATFDLVDGEQTVQLGFNLPVGNGLVLGILGTPNMTRNTAGAVFPYVSTDGSLTITGNNAGAAGRYYFCYDWQIQQPACTTPLTPVTVFVLGTGGYYFTAAGSGSPTVSFTPGDTDSADTYIWNFGDGSPVSTQMTPTHTYASTGTYTVKLIVSNGSCSDTATQTINTLALGVNDISGMTSASVYPNPAKDQITLSVNSSRQYTGCTLAVSNILGQHLYGKDVDLSDGTNSFDIDISGISAGVYIISLQNGKEMLTSKFVKE